MDAERRVEAAELQAARALATASAVGKKARSIIEMGSRASGDRTTNW